jgi:hypothetical protein
LKRLTSINSNGTIIIWQSKNHISYTLSLSDATVDRLING